MRKRKRLDEQDMERLRLAEGMAAEYLRAEWESWWPREAWLREQMEMDLNTLEAEEYDVADLVSDVDFRKGAEGALGEGLPELWRSGDKCRVRLSDPDGVKKWDAEDIEAALADPDTCDEERDRLSDLLNESKEAQPCVC